MVQKQTYSSEYIEFQEVSPSRVTPVEVPQRCRKGGVKVDIQPVSRVEAALRRALSKENLSSVWVATKPVRTVSMWLCVFLAGFGLLVFALYKLGMYVADLVGSFFVWLSESGVLVFVAIGAAVCLLVLVVVYVYNNTKRAVRFDDWQKKDTTTTTHSAGVVVNQVVNIVNGKIEK